MQGNETKCLNCYLFAKLLRAKSLFLIRVQFTKAIDLAPFISN